MDGTSSWGILDVTPLEDYKNLTPLEDYKN